MRNFAPWLLLQTALFAATVPALGQPTARQAAEAGTIAGIVRDAAGQPVAGASVVLVSETAKIAGAPSLSTKTAVDGSFSFSVPGSGKFTIQADGPEARLHASQSVELAAGETKRVNLVLAAPAPVANGSGGGSRDASAAAMQFADQPNFTVSGMTDYSNLGLHGSEATARTSDALAKETLALKSNERSGGNSGGAANNASAGRNTTDATVHRLAGDRAEQGGDPVAAVHEYEAAARLDASEENYFAWGSELLLHRAAQPAAEVFAKGSAAHPHSARMLAGLGAALYAGGQFEEAARKLCGASDLNPADPAPYLFLGKMEETATAPIACAEETLARFAREQPANALANYYYALSLAKRQRAAGGDPDSAQIAALLEKSVSLHPTFGEAYLQLGILYAASGDLVRAESALRQAIAAKPELGLAHYRLAQAYKRTGEDAKAQQEFAAYAQCEKNEAEARAREQRELRQFLITLKDPPPDTRQP
jgi:tetratricopeptide (TPR) repeat protein